MVKPKLRVFYAGTGGVMFTVSTVAIGLRFGSGAWGIQNSALLDSIMIGSIASAVVMAIIYFSTNDAANAIGDSALGSHITQNATSAITNSPTFTNAPVFAPQINFPVVTQPTPIQARTLSTPQEQPKANIVFLGASVVRLCYSGRGFSRDTNGSHSYSEVTGTAAGDMIGLVANFRNEVTFGQEVSPSRGVRAHVKLFDKTNCEIGTGFSAVYWLGHSNDTFDLIPNGRGGSVLVCWGSKTTAYISWKTHNEYGHLRDNDLELKDGYPLRAEVTIMDSKHRPLLMPVVLEITQGDGAVSVVARK